MKGDLVKALRKEFVFKDRDNHVVGKVKMVETGGTGNAHFNARRPKGGPLCNQPTRLDRAGRALSFCDEKWAPICPNRDCPGNIEPRRIMRIERYGHKTSEQKPRVSA